MSLSTRIQLSVAAKQASSAGLSAVEAALAKVFEFLLADGTGAGQADKAYSLSEQTIADGGTLSIDLKGSLTDALGAAFTPAKLKALIIFAASDNTTSLTVGGDANHVPILSAGTTSFVLKPGGVFAFVDPSLAGVAVTAATADLIKIVNGAGAAAKVSVVVIGTSA